MFIFSACLQKGKESKGFTLVELLVVLAILAILSLFGTVIYKNTITKAHSSARVHMLKGIQQALSIYYYENGSKYPNTENDWSGVCDGDVSGNNVIPGLYPGYFGESIIDPATNIATGKNCYYYVSNSLGEDYKFALLDITDFKQSDFEALPSLIDPARDGGPNPCLVDGTNYTALSITSTTKSRGWPYQNCP